ncbi:M14 family metallocarboxypeptidase [Gracilibacillus sp. YIM 98692]|uniref:M14 family metallopeptidase n=1 Tax=Gracilibacillus sp. YIM 98692 TaxID=2663532 RepID=UPI0013D1DACE|nr:M14 family metallocarboxypeptidase [Gracilibacillus sp. YIM 98692]
MAYWKQSLITLFTLIFVIYSSHSILFATEQEESNQIQFNESIYLQLEQDMFLPIKQGSHVEVQDLAILTYQEKQYSLENVDYQESAEAEDITDLDSISPITQENLDSSLIILEPVESTDDQQSTEQESDEDNENSNTEHEEKEDQEENTTDTEQKEEETTENEQDTTEDETTETGQDATQEETTKEQSPDNELTYGDTTFFQADQKDLPLLKKEDGELVQQSTLKKGKVYRFYQDIGNWLRVKIGNQIYYVWKAATIPTEQEVETNTQSSNQQLQTKQTVSVYDNSGSGLTSIGTIEPSATIDFISKHGNWYKISYLGRAAYIYGTAVIEVNPDELDYFIPKIDQLKVYHPGKIPFANLAINETYQIIGEVGNWLQVKIGKHTGYVWKSAVWKTSEEPIQTIEQSGFRTFTTTQEVPVFDNSSGSLVQVGTIEEDEEITFIKKSGNWYQIRFANRTGFIYHTGVRESFTTSMRYFQADKSNVQVMARQNGELVPIATLKQGQAYERQSDYGNWHKIKISNQTGFVWKKPTSPATKGQIPNLSSSQDEIAYYRTSKGADVYDNSSGSLESMGALKSGQNLRAISVKGNWVEVDYLGRTGFIYKPALDIVAKDVVYPKTDYTYEQMEKDLQELHSIYDDQIERKTIGQSVDGRNIYAVKLGTGDKEIFINGSHHAREHMTTNVVMEMLDQYASANARNANYYGYSVREILAEVSIWFVPMVNPDGVTLVQKGHWSANNPREVLRLNNGSSDFSSWKANIRGVDLNRQYPADWKNIRYAADNPGPKNYKGTLPLTEPEVKAIYDFTNQRNFETTVAYHSSGEIIYWYFNNPSSTYDRDEAIADQVGDITGYSPVTPSVNPSGGGYTDWFVQDHQLPGLTMEISPYTYGNPVPLNFWDKIWQENRTVGIFLANEAKNR